MPMYVCTTCPSHQHCTAWDRRCSLHQVSARLPRYLLYIEGTLTSAIPVEVFCFLLYALDLIQQNSTWVMVCTHQ